MSSLSPKTIFHPGWSADPLERRIALARVSLGVERLLPALWPAVGFAGAYAALALFGAFAFIPWALQAPLLAAVITATGLSLDENFAGFLWPQALEGARRLERDSGFAHRPISEKDDVLSGGANDGFARDLWRQHQLRAIPAGGFRIAPPHADLKSRDPRNLRYFVLIALAAGLVMARGHYLDRLVSAFDSGAGAAASIDAWIDPPAYTGLPLQSLTADDKGAVAVPAGSVLNLRVHGAPRAPGLAAGLNDAPRFAGESGEYASNAVIVHDAHVRVRVGGHAIGDWQLRAVPDAPPSIAFTTLPTRTERDAVKFSFDARDDYGVASVRVILTPHGRHGAPLSADLPLAPGKQVSQASFVDLTAHPYAGLLVDARLEARDAIGQKGLSRNVTFRLPARVFTDPLARALIEQRQNIATADAAGRRQVAAALDALAIAPERFYDGKTNIYLALRAAYWGTKNAVHAEEVTHVEDLLWQTAMALERGGLLSAAEELRKLQAQLTQALASGAPQEVIDELLRRYNQAMQRYMQALANNPPSPGQQQPLPPDAKILGQNDIQALLKAIQQLAQSGAREQAAQMLAVLQNMLENMRMAQSGQGGAGQGGQGNKALNDAIQKFGDMMGKQRMLLDKTFRQGHGQGDPKDGGPQGLSRQQGDLEKQLNDALKGLDPKLAQKLRDAGKAMGEAKGALGQKDFDNAGNAQKNALEALRQGASDLAKEAMKSQNGQREGKDDPLGRGTSPFGSSKVKIPGPSDLARAREILQELRRRAGEMNRPQQERDYIDRLLKSF